MHNRLTSIQNAAEPRLLRWLTCWVLGSWLLSFGALSARPTQASSGPVDPQLNNAPSNLASSGEAPVPTKPNAERPAFEWFATSDLVRVFEDGYGQVAPRWEKLDLFGLRNEIISAQCVLEAHRDLANVTVAVSPLKQTNGPGLIPEAAVQWNFVGSIFIEKNSPNQRPDRWTRPAPAWFPDYLSEERQCSVAQGRRKAVYLTITIAPDTPPGDYVGTVVVTADSHQAALPIWLRVYPLTMPEERHLYVTEWFSTGQFRKHHKLDPPNKEGLLRLLKLYAQNMAAHRQNVFRLGLELIGCTRSADGQLQFDFSRFDQWAQVFWDTGRMDLLETGFIAGFGEGGWSSREILLREFPVTDAATGRRILMPGQQYLPQFLPALVRHLQQRGWLAKTIFHICDEPSAHNILAWRNAAALVHRYAPELRRIDAIETPHCWGHLEIWVPKLDHLATWQHAYHEAQRQGNELWFYTVGIFQGGSLPNKTVDVPLIESRLLHWLNYRFGLRGYLHWGFNAWTDDPINAPGQHRGDGWQVYPKPDGLMNSLRWEQMRNGLQDYECLWLLQNRIAALKATLPERVAAFIDPQRRGIELASQVVADYHGWTRDPAVLYGAKRQAIEEILDLEQSPKLLLQTNPLEGSPVAPGCAIDVHGWVEPGTAIVVNGREVPVESDGLFLAQLPPTQAGTIALEARSPAGKKTVVRKFELLR